MGKRPNASAAFALALANSLIILFYSYPHLKSLLLSSAYSLAMFVLVIELLRRSSSSMAGVDIVGLSKNSEAFLRGLKDALKFTNPERALILHLKSAGGRSPFISLAGLTYNGTPTEEALQSSPKESDFEELVFMCISKLMALDTKKAAKYIDNVLEFSKELDSKAMKIRENIKVLCYRFKVLSSISSSCMSLIATLSPLIKTLGDYVKSGGAVKALLTIRLNELLAPPWSAQSATLLLLTLNLTAFFSSMFNKGKLLSDVIRAFLAYTLTGVVLYVTICLLIR